MNAKQMTMAMALTLALAMIHASEAHASLTCVTYDDSATPGGRILSWTLHGPVQWSQGQGQSGDTEPHCWVSGRELQYVQSNFTGLRYRALPTVDGSTQIIFSSDDARFIMDNL